MKKEYSNQEVAVKLSQKKNTSHVLHLLLSIITGGLWIPVWVLCALSNALSRGTIDRNIKSGPIEYNVFGHKWKD